MKTTTPLSEKQTNLEPLGDSLTILAKLRKLGWPYYSTWARAHGYHHATVRVVVAKWGESTEEPHGGIGRAIMRDLRATLEQGKRGPGSYPNPRRSKKTRR